MTDEVQFTRQNHIGIITLSRVKALNALSLAMIVAMKGQLQAWQVDDEIHAVIIRAEEGRAFCAGGDVRWLYQTSQANNHQLMDFFVHEYELNTIINHYQKPYISLMDGITMGGGVGISLHGSHPIASDNFKFAMPETTIGFFPDIGGSHLLSKCPGHMGMYLGLTGNSLDADETYACGIVAAVVESNTMADVFDDLVSCDLSTNAHESVSNCIDKYSKPVVKDNKLQLKVDKYFSFDTVEKIIDSLDGDWGRDISENLLKKSPMSLKVTCRQLKMARGLSFDECIAIDANLVRNFMRGHDFFEGVRALLIDKDNNPIWQPSKLTEITDEMVDMYFQ